MPAPHPTAALEHSPSWALISVSDKAGVVTFAQGLVRLGYRLLSTGGTAQTLREAGLSVVDVSDFTGHPECLDGRVKTLHPRVHGSILWDRRSPEHAKQAADLGLGRIDVVAVNLYPFAATVASKPGMSPLEAMAQCDIGGPAMLRSAAKNYLGTVPVCDPSDYPSTLERLDSFRQEKSASQSSILWRLSMAQKAFAHTSAYDRVIADFLTQADAPAADGHTSSPALPSTLPLSMVQHSRLRYGENPHQRAGVYRAAHAPDPKGLLAAEIKQGKELSYNNWLDLDAAWNMVQEFGDPALVIVKHNNPCGAAIERAQASQVSLTALLNAARKTDPKSSFGGVVALNRPIDQDLALALSDFFVECVIAPGASADALTVLSRKPQVRVLVMKPTPSVDVATPTGVVEIRSIRGGFLVQEPDLIRAIDDWPTKTRRAPTPEELQDLRFAWKICKHVKSNAIVVARGGATLGVGAGQMSRIDAARIALEKAADAGLTADLRGAVLASDAFFPFGDTVTLAARSGISAIVQPGGSLRDGESIAAADLHGIAMVFTGERHFRH